MKFTIKHESRGRMRVHMEQYRMTYEQADTLLYVIHNHRNVTFVKVYDRTADAVIEYVGDREQIIELLRHFHYESANVPQTVIKTSGRELNNSYQEKLIGSVVWHYSKKLLLPWPIRTALTVGRSIKYIGIGLKCLLQRKIEVPVLDATAITVSLVTKDFSTASSIMFLLGIGELLEEWTHKKSVDDLARSMSLNVSKVWLRTPENQEILVESSKIEKGDKVVVHMGNVIPFDGEVLDGDAMVNQASLTGESVPVQRTVGNTVFAGTVVEEGEITIRVKEVEGNNRFDQIVTMIEESEKLKSELEGKAEHYADKLVPWTLGATGLTYLLTRNVTKAMSILMVDFCCALKLAMPISVLSAIREASLYNVTVKGGKFLEAVAEADTIVFDKTGTLTRAHPTVVDVVNFNDEYSSDDMLRVAACLEEHFPHSMAKAVVDAASKKGLSHEEMHTKVEYIVAHGIATSINGKRTVIGSYHFVFEDEKCVVPEGKKSLFESLPLYYSHLYLAIEGKLSAVICIEDPLRDEAAAVVTSLKKAGISKVVMMTGDSERTASVIAKKVGVDEYYAEVLPEDKAAFVEKEKAKGRKVIMIGDGINDSPALSAANVGIAISDGAEIAREIADITVGSDDLYQIVTLKYISNALMKRIKSNYRKIVGFNSGLIALGVAGVLPPTTTALLHNGSTILISVNSMKNLLE
ncbi:heavy metal translocating P-type ATPase [Agathobacter rectalis]|jgi:heavy metal translocating P-type ATPase|uniref:Cd(2+)-exporting ATPase n=1 Tax=Agathobacter rectalis TaxID=39491 RepID=A0A3E5AKM4_9FIRM|nr:heavy metal translocating P-type ATPase [Agathobacter rectalis]RGN14427.1 heavy metal translocating P-type ATPase [Agathobacter rectalis]RGN20545.1 heavy metal translocating P-type ATPase [Agathobacter rectalis]RGN24077.1 heavy metal translocating P-type ATPase [Agathobacter rectalis]RGT76997.1 heavy metal translocating P-type ATPase [Agathobacter rectalis]RGT82155.1 heavy metal translocating P-type ATPase [Agathobacter rectalis]